jgi:hypothetical protein
MCANFAGFVQITRFLCQVIFPCDREESLAFAPLLRGFFSLVLLKSLTFSGVAVEILIFAQIWDHKKQTTDLLWLSPLNSPQHLNRVRRLCHSCLVLPR